MNVQEIRQIIREELRLLLSGGLSITPQVNVTEETPASSDIYTDVTSTLHLLGIKPSISGFRYIRDAVMMACDDFKVMDSITKTLYPTIARSYHTTPSRV